VEAVGVAELLWLAARHRASPGGVRLLALYSVSRGARAACALLRRLGSRLWLEELAFDYVDDVVLPDGTAGKDELLLRACPDMIKMAESHPAYEAAIRRATRSPSHDRALRAALFKRLFMDLSLRHCAQPRSVTIAAWYGQAHILYVRSQWCVGLAAGYAARWGIEVRSLPRFDLPRRWVVRVLKRWMRPVLQWTRRFRPGELQLNPTGAALPPLRVAVDCYGQGITREPIYNTEWFWYRSSALPPGAVFGYFYHLRDAITEARRAWLREAGIGWADHSALRRLKRTPLKGGGDADPQTRYRPRSVPDSVKLDTFPEALAAFCEDFYDEYAQWYRFFRATRTRIHLSSFDSYADSEAMHAALADLEGVSISIQRSIEADPHPRRRTVVDVHFAFSRAQADRERQSGSTIRQHVTAGYLFDSAFPAARAYARGLRERLQARGAKFIVCFFDENLGVHPKWLGGQRMLLGDYGFLCDRLEEDPTLGLILKPKSPHTLPQRMGPAWSRLARLMEQGRCVMLDARSTDETYLPCVAACAADVAINWVLGGTAGLESALAGVRTLLVRHRFSHGEFHHRLEGAVSFQSWAELWRAVERLRADPSDPAIGNWEPVMEQYASFRDGKASERMQAYVVWLYEALAAGSPKERALEEARERYQRAWGEEWITEISQDAPVPVFTEAGA